MKHKRGSCVLGNSESDHTQSSHSFCSAGGGGAGGHPAWALSSCCVCLVAFVSVQASHSHPCGATGNSPHLGRTSPPGAIVQCGPVPGPVLGATSLLQLLR